MNTWVTLHPVVLCCKGLDMIVTASFEGQQMHMAACFSSFVVLSVIAMTEQTQL